MKTSRFFSALALLLTGACGSSAGNIHPDVAKDVVAKDPPVALGQYRLVVGHFEANNASPECMSLRAKITGHRDQVMLGSEWRSIAETAPFKKLEDVENQFRDVKCVNNDSNPPANCAALTNQLHDHASELAQTPQWQTLENNSHWKELLEDVSKAQQIQCL